jgi:hypothetical protein
MRAAVFIATGGPGSNEITIRGAREAPCGCPNRPVPGVDPLNPNCIVPADRNYDPINRSPHEFKLPRSTWRADTGCAPHSDTPVGPHRTPLPTSRSRIDACVSAAAHLRHKACHRPQVLPRASCAVLIRVSVPRVSSSSLCLVSLPRLVSYALLEVDRGMLKLDMTRADNPNDTTTYKGTRAYLYEGAGLGAMHGQWQIEVRANAHAHAHTLTPSHSRARHMRAQQTRTAASTATVPLCLTPTRCVGHPLRPQVLLGNNYGETDSFCEAFVLSGRDEYGYYVDGLGSDYKEGPNINTRHNMPEIDVVETFWSCKGDYQYQNNCTQMSHRPTANTGERARAPSFCLG